MPVLGLDLDKLERIFSSLHKCGQWVLRVVVVPTLVFIALICYQGTPFVSIVNMCYGFAFLYLIVFLIHDILEYIKIKRETKQLMDIMEIKINKVYEERSNNTTKRPEDII